MKINASNFVIVKNDQKGMINTTRLKKFSPRPRGKSIIAENILAINMLEYMIEILKNESDYSTVAF